VLAHFHKKHFLERKKSIFNKHIGAVILWSKKHIGAIILFSLKSCSLLFQRKKPENQPIFTNSGPKPKRFIP
jgi:hypothetical protein